MPGQAIVTIGDKQWQVSLATTVWELASGLGGISGTSPGTGMLFDTGFEHLITVTTKPMLFSVDIVWMTSSMAVVDIARNVPPGQVITSSSEARYFLEVNAQESISINVGDSVVIQLLSTLSPTQLEIINFANILFEIMLMLGMVKTI